MPDTPIFLDTAIFLYAAGKDHPLREPCRDVLRRVETGDLPATTSSEVIQELLHVLIRRDQREKALVLARSAMNLCQGLLSVGHEEMMRACEILEKVDIPVRDAVHAATMRQSGLTKIVSPDRHFDSIEGITRTAI